MNWVPGENSKMEVQMNDLQNKFIQFVLEGHSILLSGGAGTGKSTALAVAGLTLRNNGKSVQFLSSTGIASIRHSNGMTIHRWVILPKKSSFTKLSLPFIL